MSNLIEVLNADNKIVINDTFKNMSLTQKHTIVSSDFARPPWATATTVEYAYLPKEFSMCDIIVVAPSDDNSLVNSGVMVSCTNYAMSCPYYCKVIPRLAIQSQTLRTIKASFTYINPIPTFDVFGFQYVENAGVSTSGLQCFDGNSKEVFNSNNKYLKIIYSSGLIPSPLGVNNSPYRTTPVTLCSYPSAYAIPTGKKYGIAFITRSREWISYVGAGIGNWNFLEPGAIFATDGITLKDVDTSDSGIWCKYYNSTTGQELAVSDVPSGDFYQLKTLRVAQYAYMIADVTGY